MITWVLGSIAVTSASAKAASHPSAFGGLDVILGIAGLLQLCVAAYAIRLNRLYGMARVGWSLFAALALLAVLHLTQAVTQPQVTVGIKLDFEVVYALISLLLLTGMVHLHAVLRQQEHARQEQARREELEAQLRSRLEQEVEKKTAHLKRAIDDLQLEIEMRKKAEAQVREQARLLDLAHDAISVHDLAGTILYWNKGAERIHGWTATEAVGRQFNELLGLESAGYRTAREVVRQTGYWAGDAAASTKHGQKILLQENWTLVQDEQGNPGSVMVISADVTEKRRLQTQTLRLQRMESIGTLAGGIAHDLNNMLTPLLMSVQVLQTKIGTESEKQLLATLQSNVLRGARLVKQILTFGRGVKGDRAIVEPARVIEELRQLILDTFPKSLELDVRLPDRSWAITGDATQIHQVLLNLCVNARDAMPAGGRLMIDVENVKLDTTYASRNVEARPGPYVMIKVTDNGMGIPRAIQARIFEPFFTTKENGKGSGLGLSTCFTIVKNHGGFITCYSEPGNGSAFKVYLPAEIGVVPAAPGPTAPADLPKGRNELVLVVDDEQVIREFAQITLECFGYRILTAADGAQAVSVYKAHQEEIAAVLMDMWMPVMDGPAAVRALKAFDANVVIIGTSGLGEIGDEKLGTGLAHFIPKPYTADSLLLGLDKVLHQPNPVVVTIAPAAPTPAVPAPDVAAPRDRLAVAENSER